MYARAYGPAALPLANVRCLLQVPLDLGVFCPAAQSSVALNCVCAGNCLSNSLAPGALAQCKWVKSLSPLCSQGVLL